MLWRRPENYNGLPKNYNGLKLEGAKHISLDICVKGTKSALG